MARVTVEDCILQIPNRFELVMMAAQRARSVSAGAALTVDRDNDKNPVVALREIADLTVDLDGLKEGVIKGLQKFAEVEEPEEEELDLLAIQQDLIGEAAAPGPSSDQEAGADDAESAESENGDTEIFAAEEGGPAESGSVEGEEADDPDRA